MLSKLKGSIERALNSLARKLPPHPNAYTLAAVIIACFIPMAALYLAFEQACLVMLVLTILSSVLDMVDGLVARVHGRVTKIGAFLDSTCDRVVDFLVVLGLYILIPDEISRVLLLTLLFFSNLVSYARARAESLGVGTMAGVGLMERPERILAEIVLIVILALTKLRYLIAIRMFLIAMLVLTLVTAVHRCIVAVKILRH